MHIGISTASFFGQKTSDEAFVRIGELGCRYCEVFLDTFSEYEKSYAKKLLKISKHNDIKILSIHAMGSQFEGQLFSKSARQRDDALKIFSDVLKACQIMGADKYVFHGPALMWGSKNRMSFNSVCPVVNDLVDIAASYGIKFCWENVSWCLLNQPEYVQAIKAQCKDIAFVLDIKQAVRSNRDPFEYLRAMGQNLAHVHICDYKNGSEIELAMPGEGDFNFTEFFSELNKMNYEHDAVIEVYSWLYESDAEIKKSLDYLSNLLY